MAEIKTLANVEKDKKAEEAAVGSSAAGTKHDPRPELPTVRFWLLAIGLCLGLFLSFIDSSIVATSLFSIGSEFNDLEKVNWVALGYTLSYLGCAVIFARISDVVGRRNAFISAFVIFFAFSIGCGFAQNMNQLIACRALQGVGGSGLYSITMIIFPEVSPYRLRQFLGSVIAVVIAVGGVLGPVLGGILTNYATWRWVFWINGPIGALSLAIFILAWPKQEYLPDLERRTWGEIDFLGSTLLIAASVLVVFSFQNVVTSAEAWGQAIFLGPLLAGIVCWICLFAWVIYASRRWGDRIAVVFPMDLMRNRIYVGAILNTTFIGFTFLMLIYNFPIRLQVVNGKSSLLAGVMLLPMLGASAMGSVIAGALNSKNDRICETLVASSSLVTLGCGLLSTLSSSFALEAKALGFIVFVGLGFGMSAAGCTIIANLQSSFRDHAAGQGIVAQVRILGGSLGIAASAAILGVTTRTQLAGVVDPSQLSSLESHISSLSPAQYDTIRQAYSDAFNKDMWVAAIFAGISVILSMATWSRKRLSIWDITERQHKDEVKRRKAGKIQSSSPSPSS